jgi:hypothetical protein
LTRCSQVLCTALTKILRKPAIALIVAAPYLVLMWPFLSSPTVGFPGDAGMTQFPAFFYVAESIRHGYGFPGWTVFAGGVPLYVLVNNLTLLLPNHLIGYLAYVVLPVSPLLMHKVVIVAGMLMLAWGWWLFLRAVCGDLYSATFGTWMILLGGTATILTQADQILAVIFWLPWIALCVWKCSENRNWAYMLPVLIGMSLQGFYPQVQLVLWFSVAIVVLVSGKTKTAWRAVRRARANTVVVMAACFLLAASPTIATALRMNEFVSPLRNYLGPNDAHHFTDADASASDWYFGNYFAGLARAKPNYQPEYPTGVRYVSTDHLLFYVGILGLALATTGLFGQCRRAWPVAALAGLLAFAAYGDNGPVAGWLRHLPLLGFGWFKQWSFLIPILNLCLSLLAATGFSFILARLRGKRRLLFLCISFALLLGDLLWYSNLNVRRFYVQAKTENSWTNGFQRCSNADFLALLAPACTNRLGEYLKRSLALQVVFKDGKLAADVLPSIYFLPYYPNRIGFLRSYLSKDAIELMTTKKSRGDLLVSDVWISGLESNSLPPARVAMELFPTNFVLSPCGLTLSVPTNPAWLIVLPCNFGNHPRCFINGRRVRAFRVNATLTGVFVPEGPYDLRVEIPRTMECCLATQWLVFAAMLLLVVRTPPNRLTDKINRLANTLDSFEKAS